MPKPRSIVELGSLEVNGTVRNIWPGAPYVGIDLIAGPGVDIVADAADWQPENPVDLVICNGVLEHTARAREICANAHRMLKDDGALILLAAGPGFPAHGAAGGALINAEWYKAISQDDLRAWLADFADVEYGEVGGMVTALARKGGRE